MRNSKNCVKLMGTEETGQLACTPSDGEIKHGFVSGVSYEVFMHFAVQGEGGGEEGEGGEGGEAGAVEPVGILVDGADLVWNDAVYRAGLSREEVIVGRLYTGPMYTWYNHILRYLQQPTPRDDDFLRQGESWGQWKEAQAYPRHWEEQGGGSNFGLFKIPFTTTLHVLNSFILKLSRIQRAQKVTCVNHLSYPSVSYPPL
jgi:hypothetical protein